MSLHDKTLFLFNKVALAKAQNTTVTSKLIDNRLNGDDVGGRVFVYARLGASAAANSVSFTLKTSADGASWATLLTAKNTADGTLCQNRLPFGAKRYLKAEAKVETALANDTTVFAELTDAIEHDWPVEVQDWTSSGADDLAEDGDDVRDTVEG